MNATKKCPAAKLALLQAGQRILFLYCRTRPNRALIVVRGNATATDENLWHSDVKIYLFDSRRLANDLAEGRVTPYQQALYLLLGFVFYAAASYSTLVYSNASRTWVGLAECVCVVTISISGVLYAYKRNGGDSGDQFVPRFICLLLPVSINIYIIVWALYHLLTWWFFKRAIYDLSFSSQEATDQFIRFVQYDLPWVVTFIFVVLTQILIFVRIAHHVSTIRRYENIK